MQFDDIFDYHREKGYLEAEKQFFNEKEFEEDSKEVELFINFAGQITKYELKSHQRTVLSDNSERSYLGWSDPINQ